MNQILLHQSLPSGATVAQFKATAGQWNRPSLRQDQCGCECIDGTETVSMNDLFDRMSTQELEAYAQTVELPEWFRAMVGATK
jgi:hypothetical protein